MSGDRRNPVRPDRRRRERRDAWHRTGVVLLVVGIVLFVASNLGSRIGFPVLPFDPHHTIGQVAGAAFGLLGLSLMGRQST